MEKSYPSLSSLSRRLLLKQSRGAKALPTTEEQEILTTTTTPTRLPNYWGTTPEQDYYNLQGIKSSKSFYTSPRGLKLLTRQWLPLRRPRLYGPRLRQRHQLDLPSHPDFPRPNRLRLHRSRPWG
ncbi:hypothetical protein ACFX2J_036669 [Malus domestica]